MPASKASKATVGSLFSAQVRLRPDAVALQQDYRTLSYRDLDIRAGRAASVLAGLGVGLGARIAILSENRLEYFELILAATKLNAILACQNWRLTSGELGHCLELVDPAVLVVSPRFIDKLNGLDLSGIAVVTLDRDWEGRLSQAEDFGADRPTDLEDPLLILYTGGTTGLPKGAVLSHRAEIARLSAFCFDMGVSPGATNLAWPPYYHMGGAEPALTSLLSGGRVLVEDGFNADRLVDHMIRERFDWVSMQPGTVGAFADAIERRGAPMAGVKGFGAMPDLVPTEDAVRAMRLLNAPYINTFGSTETGTPPLSGGRLAFDGRDLAKTPSAFCDMRLVDEAGRTVPDGETGEIAMRGPTLFSGYWRNDAATAQDFRDGWFHMGDLFRRREDGKFVFVDRAKYMIKSGGENIYPAEIERVLMSVAGVREAVVVKRRDTRWGEVPVALVSLNNVELGEAELFAVCRAELAGYKQPKAIIFVPPERLARTPTGKIPRAALEEWVVQPTVVSKTEQ